MSSRSILPFVMLAAALVVACSSSTTGTGTGTDGGTGTSGGGEPAGSSPTCSDFGGSCAKLDVTKTCAGGTVRVSDATLCPSATPDCCVLPPAAGTVVPVKDSALACSTGGKFPSLAGTCGGQPCQLGCECGASGGSAVCDCSRGLPSSSAGHEACAVFACGVITCGVGCRCTDATLGACTCP